MLNAEVGGSDIGSDGWAGITALKNKNSDAVRSVYAKFKTVRDSPHACIALPSPAS